MIAWRVAFDGGTAFVSGPKAESRRRLAVCGDDAPPWVSRREAWATSPRAASRLLDQLEHLGIAVVVEDRAQAALAVEECGTEPANSRDVQEALW